MASGLRFFALSAESSAMESIRKTRRIAIIFSSSARWIMFARVEITPSACVLRRRKSTEISFAARPLIRSAWTMAIFPASLICRTISDIAVKHEYGLDIGAQALRQPLVVAHSGDNGVALQGFIKSLFQISFRLPPYSGFCQMQKKHSKHAARFVRLSPCSILRAFF